MKFYLVQDWSAQTLRIASHTWWPEDQQRGMPGWCVPCVTAVIILAVAIVWWVTK